MPVRGGIVTQRLGHAPRPRSFLVPTIAGTAAGFLALALTHADWRSAVIGTFIAAIIAVVVRGRHRLCRPGVTGPAHPGRCERVRG